MVAVVCAVTVAVVVLVVVVVGVGGRGGARGCDVDAAAAGGVGGWSWSWSWAYTSYVLRGGGDIRGVGGARDGAVPDEVPVDEGVHDVFVPVLVLVVGIVVYIYLLWLQRRVCRGWRRWGLGWMPYGEEAEGGWGAREWGYCWWFGFGSGFGFGLGVVFGIFGWWHFARCRGFWRRERGRSATRRRGGISIDSKPFTNKKK